MDDVQGFEASAASVGSALVHIGRENRLCLLESPGFQEALGFNHNEVF